MLERYLNKDTVEVEVDCHDWENVAYQVGSLLVKKEVIEEEYIEQTIASVKKFGPYIMLVPGIAFFHSEPSKAVHSMGISFITLKDTVYIDSEKKKKIECAFAFAAVDNNSHLELLTKLASVLKDNEALEKLKSHPTKAEVLDIIKNVEKGE